MGAFEPPLTPRVIDTVAPVCSTTVNGLTNDVVGRAQRLTGCSCVKEGPDIWRPFTAAKVCVLGSAGGEGKPSGRGFMHVGMLFV